jgi:hypothetical protein
MIRYKGFEEKIFKLMKKKIFKNIVYKKDIKISTLIIVLVVIYKCIIV